MFYIYLSVVVSNPLGAGKPTPSPFDLSAYVTHQVLTFKQLSQGNAPAVRERAGTSKERLYNLHQSHTTQVTASKARQGRLKSPGSTAL
ncbi:hypothetical protein TNCV_5045481 [Trichonephila clavipes]|uniref:Uncharacterized protein n=1 Tax=Trichonephila clavipes TaxID=2585209 RepID=A0A8X6WHK0_TRICX|nr:hypothetical protein TNCV_5045481 [Trichonephila clavipes]